MAKKPARHITQEEFECLPFVFGVGTMAQILGSNQRYVSNHATELGGKKLAGRWQFTLQGTKKLLEIV